MAATTYAGMLETLEGVLKDMIPGAVAQGFDVPRPKYPFRRADYEERPANVASGGFRHFWFNGGEQVQGALAMGTGPRHVVRRLTLYVQYPTNLRGLEAIIGTDQEMVETRIQDPKYQGWPDSGVMNVRHSGAVSAATEDGRVVVAHSLRVHYLSQPF